MKANIHSLVFAFFLACLLFAAPLGLRADESEATPPASETVAAAATPAEASDSAPAAPVEKTVPVITIGGTAGYDDRSEKGFVGSAFISLGLDTRPFDLIARLSLESDGKYAPAEANIPGKEFFGLYFWMDEGGIRVPFGPLTLEAGRFRHYDEIDSPYSLFINGLGHSALLMNLRYEDDFFIYQTRWIELNNHSAAETPAWPDGYIDRGANVKTYGFKVAPGMRFGFQDAAVYTGRSFDYEYFLNPIPQYFLQYAKTNSGRPWTTGGNEGNSIGAFFDWELPSGATLNAQVLMDDFNVHFLFPDTPWNPWKLAWTFGGSLKTEAGKFALYCAGATKYTFEPISMKDASNWTGKAYGYTYYPDTVFDYDSTELREIGIEDNAIGYLYGENNFAIRLEWSDRISGYDLGAGLEFRLMGENSPANPWHELYGQPDDGTHWLDDAVLEKRFLAVLQASRQVGDWRFFSSLSIGVALDALKLGAVTLSSPANGTSDGDLLIQMYTPVEGNTQPILRLRLGASYSIRTR